MRFCVQFLYFDATLAAYIINVLIGYTQLPYCNTLLYSQQQHISNYQGILFQGNPFWARAIE